MTRWLNGRRRGASSSGSHHEERVGGLKSWAGLCGHTVHMRGFGPFMSRRGSHNKVFVFPLVYRELVFSTVSAVLWCEKSFGPLGCQDCNYVRANEAVSSARDFTPSSLFFLSFFLKLDLRSAVSWVKGYRVRLDTESSHPSSLEVWEYSVTRPPPLLFPSQTLSIF